ncbi:MAG TPA: hypothetical protein VMS65_01505, partial [Polyangiaceae bacterium]|nr:hypothetical protein [Polyangiaceae bacterium]
SDELGGWQRQAKREPPVAARKPLVVSGRSGPRLVVGNRPNESQVTLEVGCVLPVSDASSVPAEDVFESLLDEALDAELRQRTGATYGVHASLERLRGGTTVLHVTSAVGYEQLEPSLKTLYAWFGEDTPRVTEDAVALARFDAVQSTFHDTETSLDLASQLFEYARRGLTPSDLEQRPKRIAAVQPDAVERLLAACRRTSLFSAVGDERRIRGAWPGG